MAPVVGGAVPSACSSAPPGAVVRGDATTGCGRSKLTSICSASALPRLGGSSLGGGRIVLCRHRALRARSQLEASPPAAARALLIAAVYAGRSVCVFSLLFFGLVLPVN
jgi:hypothetical protein